MPNIILLLLYLFTLLCALYVLSDVGPAMIYVQGPAPVVGPFPAPVYYSAPDPISLWHTNIVNQIEYYFRYLSPTLKLLLWFIVIRAHPVVVHRANS